MVKQCICGQHAVLIDLKRIDEVPGPYAMSFGFDLEPLCESIREVGLVHPPCIALETRGPLEIVTGYRRVLALKRLGWSEVTCEDVSELLPSPLERLLFAFHENRAVRSFNDVEKAMILKRLETHLGKRDVLERFMPMLGLPCHEKTLDFYLNLAGMKSEYLDGLAEGRLSLHGARSLLELEPESAQCAFRTILNLELNFNQQLQFFDIMIDLCKKEGLNFAQILGAEPFRSVLESRRLNKPQKAKKLLEELQTRRYPRLKKAEKRFREQIERLSLPYGTRIDHPAYFEAPGYRLEVGFTDGKNLMEKLLHLSRISALGEFRDPVDDND